MSFYLFFNDYFDLTKLCINQNNSFDTVTVAQKKPLHSYEDHQEIDIKQLRGQAVNKTKSFRSTTLPADVKAV